MGGYNSVELGEAMKTIKEEVHKRAEMMQENYGAAPDKHTLDGREQ